MLLGIDTSSAAGSVALLDGKGRTHCVELSAASDYARRLLPTLQALLNDCGVGLEQIGLFAAVTGPGSFTGLRVGLATVKALAESLRKRVAARTALEVLAYGYRNRGDRISVWLDAGRGQVFAAAFGSSGEQLMAPLLGSPAEILRRMDQLPTLVVGSAAVLHAAELQRHQHLHVIARNEPLAPWLCQLARETSETTVDPAVLDGFYVRSGLD